MRALNLLTWLSLSYSFFIIDSFADTNLDAYISSYKKEQFNYDYSKNESQSSQLRDSWIAPIKLNYSYLRSNPYVEKQTNQSASIRVDQPIFQSGGIYYGIKYANATKKYSDYSVDVVKRKLIKDAISLLMQIKQIDLKKKKQEFAVLNSEINLEQKKEQYLSGQLDSSFLDDAIIQHNTTMQTLFDIETSKERLVTKFQTISDLDYKTATIPHLEFINFDRFMKNNISLKKVKSKSNMDKYAKNVRVAKYLPKVSLTGGYNWNKSSNQKLNIGGNIIDNSSENDYYDYGFRVSIPIDINSLRDIQTAKLDFLKSKILEIDKRIELKAIFKQVVQNIKNLDKKITLSSQNIKLYKKLLDDTRKLYSAGYKTKYDVERLKNSFSIQSLDKKIYEIDKQLELLTLYEMYVNGE